MLSKFRRCTAWFVPSPAPPTMRGLVLDRREDSRDFAPVEGVAGRSLPTGAGVADVDVGTAFGFGPAGGVGPDAAGATAALVFTGSGGASPRTAGSITAIKASTYATRGGRKRPNPTPHRNAGAVCSMVVRPDSVPMRHRRINPFSEINRRERKGHKVSPHQPTLSFFAFPVFRAVSHHERSLRFKHRRLWPRDAARGRGQARSG